MARFMGFMERAKRFMCLGCVYEHEYSCTLASIFLFLRTASRAQEMFQEGRQYVNAYMGLNDLAVRQVSLLAVPFTNT